MQLLDLEKLQYYDGKIKTYFAKTYAPLASPSFTGTPTSTTPSAGDSSTKIATTKYVQTELGTAKVASAGEFTAAKSVTLTGDVTGTASSKGGWSIAATLASSGVTADTYGPSANASPAHSGTFTVPKITVDAKGRVTSASNITITLPASGNVDTKVTQTVTANTDEGKYPILAKNVTATATITDTSRFVDGITIQPSTGAIQATKFIGTLEGNASSATKLATARNINGTSFNGTSAITTATWGTARNISISDADGTNTGDATSVNGSAAVTLKLPSTIKASLEGNASSADSIPWSGIDGKPNTFAPSSHNQASSTINAMTGYSKPSSTGAIATTDSLNAAIGKLEKALDGKQASGSYAAASHNQASSTINAMTGYSKPSSTSAIGTSDTLNAAIGKLEKALDGKQASGSYAAASHNHDASNINSGTLNAARIPNLDASKITSGTIDIARLPAGALERLVTVANQTARFALTTSNVQLGDTVRQSDTGLMYYVVDTSKLSSADGYAEYTAGAATSVPWSGVTGKPSTFAPSSHNQASNTINAMTGYSKPSSTSAIGTSDTLNAAIGKLEKALDGKAASATTLAGYNISDAKIASGIITLGSNTITPLTSSSSLNAAKLTGTASVNTTGNAATVTGTAGTSALAWNSEVTLYTVGGNAIKAKLPANPNSDTKNTAGSTDSSSKLFLIGATSQAANPQTYSHDTAYVGTDGCLYSGGTKVLTAHQTLPTLSYTESGSGNAITGISVSNHAITATKGSTFLTSHQSLANYVTLNGAQTISAVKTFTAKPVLNQVGLDMTVKDTTEGSTTTRTSQVLHANSSNSQYGINIAFCSGGNAVVGGGEAGTAQLNALAGNTGEDLYLVADGNIYLKPNGNTWANAKTITLSNAAELSGLAKVTSTSFVGALTGNADTATKFASSQSVTLTGAVTGTASSQAGWSVGTVWRSCLVGQSGSTNTNPWYKVATFAATGANDDIIATFLVEDTYSSHKQGILKVHVRTDGSKVISTTASDLIWLSHTGFTLADFVLVCPTAASSTVEIWTKIATAYMYRRFTVLSEGSRSSTSIRWTLLNASSAGQAASITTTGTQIASTLAGQAASCTGNAATATKLATTRAINGTNFDGSAAITTANWGTARNIYVADSDGTNTGAAVSVNGSANATLKLPATIKASITGNVSGSSGSCTGNAATATKLATARSLWGNNFDGSAAISGTITGTPSIEFKPAATTSNNGGYLDFHYNQSTADYTSRIIESASGTLSINNVTITTGKVVTATTFTGALSGNASSATITKGNKGTGSYVTSVKSGNALVNADNTQFGTIFNAPTKNYRVGCATWPDSNDNIVFYSITNANVSSSTNTVNKTMTWNGDTGILTATGFAGPLTGNVTGNVSGSSGSCTGNAATATKLATARTINGVSFDGSANITVADSTKLPLAGGTMTGQITYKVGSITRGTAPSSSQYPWGIRMIDNASVALSGLYYEYLTDKTARTHLMCYQGTTNANTWKSIGIGYNTSGNPYTWSITPGFGDNSTQIATTEFVYNNAAKHLAAATSIYVAKAATGNGSGSNTSNYMSLADLRNYLATVHMHSSTADMNGSYALTILFKAGDSFGNASFDATKMPGIRNLVLNTSTGTASTTSNYSTNSPTFGNIAVSGDIAVTIRNINCTGRISAQYGAYVAVDTYVGLSSLHASNWAYVNVAKNMVIDVCDAHTDYLFAATNSGILAMWPGATVTINFRQQCWYTRCLFMSSTNGTILVGYSSFKLTGTKPVAIWAGSGTLTGTSETAAGTAAKVVPLASGQTFTLATNATAKIRFTNDNTAANPTLNINSTGAKAIWWNGAAVAANMLAKNMTYDVKYDGTRYVIQNTIKRLTNNDFGVFRYSGDYATTYNSGSWNFSDWTPYFGTGLENSTFRGSHIGNIQQNVTTSNNTYPVLFTGTANATANTSTYPYFGSGVKINPSTSTVYATTFSGAFSGNASTATKLATARSINIQDSSATNTGTAASFDGSGNATIKLPATIKASITGNCSGSSGSCTGNAATATTLATARTIAISGGATGTATSFNGSANITIPVTALDVSKASAGTLAVARGGTGLTSLDTFVRTTGNQTIAGTKTFSAEIMVNKGDKPAAGALSHVFGVTYQNTGGTQTHTAHPISVIGTSNADNAYNTGVRLGSLNGTTVVSAGESGGSFCTKLSKFDDENLYLEADNEVQIYCKCANDMATYAGPIRFYGSANASGGTTTVAATNFAGNASTATKLATARNINGVAFDGSANITVADSTKVAKAGDTMTGNLTISKAGPVIVTKSTGMTRNTAPSAAVNTVEVLGQDSAGKSTWGIYHTYGTDKANRAQLICYKGTSTDNTWSGIGIGYDKDGNVYTNAPTPAATDSSTKIATTAWVKARIGNGEYGMRPNGSIEGRSNGTTYTASCNGYVYGRNSKYKTCGTETYVEVIGYDRAWMQNTAYGSGSCNHDKVVCLPVKKGQQYKCSNLDYCGFIPAG